MIGVELGGSGAGIWFDPNESKFRWGFGYFVTSVGPGGLAMGAGGSQSDVAALDGYGECYIRMCMSI